MLRVSLRASVIVLSLGLTLASGASAAPLRWGGFFSGEVSGLLDRLEATFLGGAHLKRGRSVDPNRTPKRPPVITPKAGCGISPDGKPVCTP